MGATNDLNGKELSDMNWRVTIVPETLVIEMVIEKQFIGVMERSEVK